MEKLDCQLLMCLGRDTVSVIMYLHSGKDHMSSKTPNKFGECHAEMIAFHNLPGFWKGI